jgi:hypothetical protein
MNEENKIPPEEIPQKQPVNKVPADENILPTGQAGSSVESIAEVEQSEIPPLSWTEQQQTTNSSTEALAQAENKLQTEEMETHADHLHKAPGHGWKHYFFEFLMLFFAVFCGFLAENQREHYIEKKRAKEFAKLLMDDLRFDIAELNKAEKVLNNIITAGDSLARLLSYNNITKIPGGKLYYYEYWSGWRWNIISRDATLQQLKSSGALRYISNPALIRKILSYEESVRVIYMLQNKYEPEKIQNWNLVQKVFYQDYFNILDNDPALARDSTVRGFTTNNARLDSFINTDYPLYTYDKNILFELKNWAYNSSRNYKVTVNDIKTMRAKAHNVIEGLKKEYHLK